MDQLYDFCFERAINVTHNGKTTTGQIRIGSVERVERHGCWGCRWSISVIHPEEGVIHGEDPLHALTLCIWFVDKLIRDADADGIEVWWLSRGDFCSLLPDR